MAFQVSRPPFFDSPEGVLPSPEHARVRDYLISCGAMQRKSFCEGMGAQGRLPELRRYDDYGDGWALHMPHLQGTAYSSLLFHSSLISDLCPPNP